MLRQTGSPKSQTSFYPKRVLAINRFTTDT